MSTPVAPVLDLLRERRRELGIEPLSSTLSQRRGLLQRGGLIGLGVVGVMAGLCAALLLQHAVVKARMARLNQVEAESQQLRSLLTGRQQKLAGTTSINRTLATALTSSRTSAALLAELQLITPQGVQLTTADSSGDSLTLKGQAIDPYALVRINALQLQLQRSALFQSDGVRLTKVERQPPRSEVLAAARKAHPERPPEPGPVLFEITAGFSNLSPADQLAQLSRLGSEGMAGRLRLLRQEGLMP
jgi:type IV pilus assembly protein PilN